MFSVICSKQKRRRSIKQFYVFTHRDKQRSTIKTTDITVASGFVAVNGKKPRKDKQIGFFKYLVKTWQQLQWSVKTATLMKVFKICWKIFRKDCTEISILCLFCSVYRNTTFHFIYLFPGKPTFSFVFRSFNCYDTNWHLVLKLKKKTKPE